MKGVQLATMWNRILLLICSVGIGVVIFLDLQFQSRQRQLASDIEAQLEEIVTARPNDAHSMFWLSDGIEHGFTWNRRVDESQEAFRARVASESRYILTVWPKESEEN